MANFHHASKKAEYTINLSRSSESREQLKLLDSFSDMKEDFATYPLVTLRSGDRVSRLTILLDGDKVTIKLRNDCFAIENGVVAIEYNIMVSYKHEKKIP